MGHGGVITSMSAGEEIQGGMPTWHSADPRSLSGNERARDHMILRDTKLALKHSISAAQVAPGIAIQAAESPRSAGPPDSLILTITRGGYESVVRESLKPVVPCVPDP